METMVEYSCDVCGNKFIRGRSWERRVKHKLCSRKCRQTKFIPETCQECGKAFYRTAQAAQSKFCSHGCFLARDRREKRHQKCTLATLQCKQCGRVYKARNSVANKQIYCSKECGRASQIGKRTGAANHKWKPKVKITCGYCGKVFETYPSRAGRKKYCCKSHLILANLNRLVGNKRTDIERAMAKALSDHGISFREQVPMFGKFQVDFLLGRVVVQCDGIYWHDRPNVKTRDKGQDAYLTKCGYTVLRFTDRQINKDINGCVDKIKLTLRE